MNDGYIALWRKLRENPLWKERRRFSRAEAWIDLLMDTHWQDETVLLGTTIVSVKRGQALLSQRKKAAQWGWARNSVHAFLSMLKNAGMVSHEVSQGPEGGYTLLTILKYEEYQPGPNHQKPLRLSHGLSQRRATVEPAIEPRSEPRLEPPLTDEKPASGFIREERSSGALSHDLSHDFDGARSGLEHREEVRSKNLAGDSAPAGDDASRRPGKGNGKATEPNVKLVIDAYHNAFLKRHGTPPPINGGKCGRIAKSMLRGRPIEEVLWVMEEFFQGPPAFYRDRGLYGMEHVLAAMPTLLARKGELERGV